MLKSRQGRLESPHLRASGGPRDGLQRVPGGLPSIRHVHGLQGGCRTCCLGTSPSYAWTASAADRLLAGVSQIGRRAVQSVRHAACVHLGAPRPAPDEGSRKPELQQPPRMALRDRQGARPVRFPGMGGRAGRRQGPPRRARETGGFGEAIPPRRRVDELRTGAQSGSLALPPVRALRTALVLFFVLFVTDCGHYTGSVPAAEPAEGEAGRTSKFRCRSTFGY